MSAVGEEGPNLAAQEIEQTIPDIDDGDTVVRFHIYTAWQFVPYYF